MCLEMLILYVFYGGMLRAKAAKSLRLFAEAVIRCMPSYSWPGDV
jgi:hypothetical protein